LAVPRQNRVTPAGDVIATPERGTFFGNRGVLHDDQGRIRRAWQLKRWLICVLEYKGRRRAVMTPGRYTELFFLDEATALAAGHRPCAECRRERFNAFCAAWRSGNARIIGSQKPTAPIIDDRLHAERLSADGSKRSFLADLDRLPSGVLIRRKEGGEENYLLWGDRLFCWSSGGYLAPRLRPKREKVCVLTPKSTVAAIRAGYVPEIHPSANV
jgi:methylphosphotriester-DNA--protein-cysteine methyltransferase